MKATAEREDTGRSAHSERGGAGTRWNTLDRGPRRGGASTRSTPRLAAEEHARAGRHGVKATADRGSAPRATLGASEGAGTRRHGHARGQEREGATTPGASRRAAEERERTKRHGVKATAEGADARRRTRGEHAKARTRRHMLSRGPERGGARTRSTPRLAAEEHARTGRHGVKATADRGSAPRATLGASEGAGTRRHGVLLSLRLLI